MCKLDTVSNTNSAVFLNLHKSDLMS